jgi:hypothetical protein
MELARKDVKGARAFDKEDVMIKHGAAMGGSLAVVLALAAASASAVEDHDNGFYLGGGIGDFSADLNTGGDFENVHLDFKNQDANRILGGWRFNRYLSVQVDWTDFGRGSAGPPLLGLTADSDALTPAVIGTLPVGPVELFAKAGVMHYNVKIDDSTGRSFDDTGHDPLYGVGIGFTVVKRLNLNVEYERIHMAEFDNANAAWLNASWRF